MRSIHQSLLALRQYALAHPTQSSPGSITRTLKVKVDTGSDRKASSLHFRLNRLFDANQSLLRSILIELQSIWERNRAEFIAIVGATKDKPVDECISLETWLQRKFLTGKEPPEGLTRPMAKAIIGGVAGNMKSFLTRRETVSKEMESVLGTNLRLWEKEIPLICRESGVSLIDGPPAVTPGDISLEQVEVYNRWVARVRSWCNLVLVQGAKLERREVPVPRYLKAYPGFPGSRRYDDGSGVEQAIRAFHAILESSQRHLAGYDKMDAEKWEEVLSRFRPSAGKSQRRLLGSKLDSLLRKNPEATPREIATRAWEWIFSEAVRLQAHLAARKNGDRRALIKLINILNLGCLLAEEPLRAAGDFAAFEEADEPRRDAFGVARGSLTEPTDDTSAIPILGFSVKEDGGANYNGFLARERLEGGDRWAFALDHNGDCQLALDLGGKKAARKIATAWEGYGTQGGARKKEHHKPKSIAKGTLLHATASPPMILPLLFGRRQGREFFWNFDRPLGGVTEGWTLANGRILRVLRERNPYTAVFYLTVTFARDTPPLSSPAGGLLVGIDRGEACPASYAVVTSVGKVVTTGKIAEEYREQQQRFASQKADLQRTKGGYTRSLRAKERNRARALQGEVVRSLLNLAAEHSAPLIFERLGSGISTRGGARTQMSVMQYEKILTAVEQKLTESGCYLVPGKPDYRKAMSGFVGFVSPAYTSSTCSACGQIHGTEFYENILPTVARRDGGWGVEVNGRVVAFPESYTSWTRQGGEVMVRTSDKLEELLRGEDPSGLPKTRRERLLGLLRAKLIPWRPTQDRFRCVNCGHEADADEQAAVNIARKSLFTADHPGSKDSSEAARRKGGRLWGEWYARKVADGWA